VSTICLSLKRKGKDVNAGSHTKKKRLYGKDPDLYGASLAVDTGRNPFGGGKKGGANRSSRTHGKTKWGSNFMWGGEELRGKSCLHRFTLLLVKKTYSQIKRDIPTTG